MYGWSESNRDDEMKPYWIRRNEITVQDGCLLWGLRIVVPQRCRRAILEQLHEAHVGIVRMKALARSHIWWPKLDDDVEHLAKSCYSCAQLNPNPPKAPLHSWEWPERAWQRIHIDYAGPFLNRNWLIIVDAHSEFPVVVPMAGTSASDTVLALYAVFAEHGLPEQLVSDNGGQFISAEFAQFCSALGISHIRMSAYHASTNGKAERFVRTFKEGMTAMKSETGTVEFKLSKFLFRYRTTPHSTTGRTPAELLYGRKLRTALDLLKPSTATQLKVDQSLIRQQRLHDSRAKNRNFQVGDEVFVRCFVGQRKWRAGVIAAQAAPLTYDVKVGNEVLRRHIDHLIGNATGQRDM